MLIALALAAAMLLVPVPVSAAGAAPDGPPAAAASQPLPSPSAEAAELDSLFAALKDLTDDGDARTVEARIQALWLDSGDAEVNRLMDYAVAAINARAYALAVGYLDSIILRQPDYAEGWNKRATVYWLMGAYDRSYYARSLADIDRTLALEPRHWGALAGRGWILQDFGEDRRAIDAFRQALAIDPNREDVRVSLRLLEDKLGKGI
jgi:tetratricopeptide (TPR) repeat protein